VEALRRLGHIVPRDREGARRLCARDIDPGEAIVLELALIADSAQLESGTSLVDESEDGYPTIFYESPTRFVLFGGCGSPGVSPSPTDPGSEALAPPPPPSAPVDDDAREPSSAGVVFEAAGGSLAGVPSAGQPAPHGPIIEPNFTVIGGPTDAGAGTIEDITSLSFEGVDAFWEAFWMPHRVNGSPRSAIDSGAAG